MIIVTSMILKQFLKNKYINFLKIQILLYKLLL